MQATEERCPVAWCEQDFREHLSLSLQNHNIVTQDVMYCRCSQVHNITFKMVSKFNRDMYVPVIAGLVYICESTLIG